MNNFCPCFRERQPELKRWYCIAEPINTLSNCAFSILAILRCIYPMPQHTLILYNCLFAAGLCSAFHHATPFSWKWTIVIDYLPIVIGVSYGWYTSIIAQITPATLFLIILSFACLLADHIWTPIPVPWGHSFWHILAAIAFDATIQDSLK